MNKPSHSPKPKPKSKNEDKAQSKRFVETARELGADESGHAFERAFDVVAPSTPAADPARRRAKPTSS
jgi:hypothetical protein